MTADKDKAPKLLRSSAPPLACAFGCAEHNSRLYTPLLVISKFVLESQGCAESCQDESWGCKRILWDSGARMFECRLYAAAVIEL